jgi:phage baseplate assembly protein W
MAMAQDIIGTGIAFPLTLDVHGGLGVSDGEQSIRDAIAIILGTSPGERLMRPEFGCRVHELVFESMDALTAGRIEREVRVALDRWEPRIDVLEVRARTSRVADGVLEIEIGYRVRATNDVRNLVHPFYVIPEDEAPLRVATSSSTTAASRTSLTRRDVASATAARHGRTTMWRARGSCSPSSSPG